MLGIATSARSVSYILERKDCKPYESAPLEIACNTKDDHADRGGSVNRSGGLQASEKIVSNR